MRSPFRFLSLPIALAAPLALGQTRPADCPMHEAHAAKPPEAAQAAAPEQHGQHEHGAMSPYAGKEGSEIKALTADEVKAYREGTGMGMAKPAELNHYPGPRHVLDMAAELKVTHAQKADLEKVFRSMHEDAVALGTQILEKEKSLDAAFAAGSIDEKKLAGLTSDIAALQARLRAAHLKAHVATRRILTAEQIARYDELRGYSRS